MTYKKNDIINLKIESLGQNGEGISHLDGQVVFVTGALPGEEVEAQLLKVGRSAIWARLHKKLTIAPQAQDSDCPLYPKCGGCQFRHMTYGLELEAKAQRVNDALQRIGGLDLTISQIHGAQVPSRYRNKVQLPVAQGPKVGFYRARSHDVVDAPDCLLQPGEVAPLRQALVDWMETYHVLAYDEKTHKGLIRHFYVRFSQTQALVCIVANGDKLPHCDALVEGLRNAIPNLAGIVLSVNTAKTNVILGQKLTTLWGQDYLDDTLCGLTFRISVHSFYQINHAQTQVLYGKAVEAAGLTGTETVLDLYCGIGTISLCMAQKAGRVIGAEIVPQAIEDATQNARRNGIENAEFVCADASDIARKLAEEGLKPDVISVDPPRKGLAPDVITAIVQMAPEKVVYVSCDPATLARDLALFTQQGYTPITAQAVDMFPRTAHVETVILLSQQKCEMIINNDSN